MATLIHGGYVVTLNGARDVHPRGFVLLGDDGRIEDVGPDDRMPERFAGERLDASGMIVLPGLVDAGHRPWQHLVMGLGSDADGRLLSALEHQLDAGDLALGATLAAAELVAGGVTTVLHALPGRADPSRLAAAAKPFEAMGLRQVVGIDWAGNSEAGAMEALRLCETTAHASLALSVITDPVSMLAGDTHEPDLAAAYAFARSHDLRLLTRPGGDADDTRWQAARSAHGRSAPVHLMELGLLDERWLLAGAERLDDTDLLLIQESGCSAIASPLDDAVRGVASTHWTTLAHRGVTCALSTGGPAFSCTVDMVEEMKAMVMLQNTLRRDPTSMSTEAALEMATLGGARALGLDGEIGSLEPGKRADVAVFDLRQPHHQASHKPISTFVCCARAGDAHAVYVQGRRVHDATRPRARGEAWVTDAFARRAALMNRARAARPALAAIAA